jgi:hypothetical protein
MLSDIKSVMVVVIIVVAAIGFAQEGYSQAETG